MSDKTNANKLTKQQPLVYEIYGMYFRHRTTNQCIYTKTATKAVKKLNLSKFGITRDTHIPINDRTLVFMLFIMTFRIRTPVVQPMFITRSLPFIIYEAIISTYGSY